MKCQIQMHLIKGCCRFHCGTLQLQERGVLSVPDGPEHEEPTAEPVSINYSTQVSIEHRLNRDLEILATFAGSRHEIHPHQKMLSQEVHIVFRTSTSCTENCMLRVKQRDLKLPPYTLRVMVSCAPLGIKRK